MQWRDEDTLLDIITAGDRVIAFQQNMSEDEFLRDVKTQSAIQHQLTIMGEAVKRLSAEFRAQHPEIPWRLVAGMRDRLIHGYDRVSVNVVWDTATRSVPDLLVQLRPLLADSAGE